MIAELFDASVRMTLAGSFAVIVVLALRVTLRRRVGAQLAYASWTLAPIAAIAMLLPAPAQPVANFVEIVQWVPAAAPTSIEPQAVFEWRPIVFALWSLGALLSAVWFAAQQRRYLRSLGRLQARDGDRILQSEFDTGGPALVGAWRRRVVLPADFEARYSQAERELILAHERMHQARGDASINALVLALRCLNWFNPLLHYAAAKFRLDQEFACDAAVLARFPEERRRYAGAMLKVQLADQPRQELRLPVGCRWPSGHPLKERIVMLNKPLPSRLQRAGGVAVVTVAAVAASLISWVALSSPVSAAARTSAETSGSVAASYRRLSRPAYPEQLIASRIEGIVYVDAQVDTAGKVTAVKVDHTEPSTARDLAEPALAAVKLWTFEPAQENGKPVSTHVLVPLRYTLADSKPISPPQLPAGAMEMIVVTGAPKSP